MTMSCQ